MKRFLPLLAVLLGGCIIHSVERFYTEKSRVAPTEFLGKWQLLKSYDTDVSTNRITPWSLEAVPSNSCTLVTYDENNWKASFTVTFFKSGTNLFLDFTAGTVGDDTNINEYWSFAVQPVHGVCKVTITSNQWRMITLDYDWVKESLKNKKITLSHHNGPDDWILFTAPPEALMKFLKQYGSSPDAFPEKHAFVLQRISENKP